jgi:hypothetical protein
MNSTAPIPTDQANETFRAKILRKCGESVAMKEQFFERYAESLEELSREMARRFAAAENY